jgi:hypothetical protein
MSWMRWLAIVIGSGFVASMTDWLTAGDWIHRRWSYPEAWRPGSESRAIVVSSLLPFVTAAAFVFVADRLQLHATLGLLKFAFAIWVIGPLPLILTNAAFIKLHRVFVTFYAVGWLVKLCIIALTYAMFRG